MAPIPEVRVEVLRSFYVSKDDLKVKGTFAYVPARIVSSLISDGKARYAPEKAREATAKDAKDAKPEKAENPSTGSGQAPSTSSGQATKGKEK